MSITDEADGALVLATSLDVLGNVSPLPLGRDWRSEGEQEDDYCYSIEFPDSGDPELPTLVRELGLDSRGVHNCGAFGGRIVVVVKLWGGSDEAFRDARNPARLVEELINHFLVVFEHFYLEFAVPRFRLDGRVIVEMNHGAWRQQAYSPDPELELEEIFADYSVVGYPYPSDLVTAGMSSVLTVPASWGLFVDAVGHYRTSAWRESLVSCCSAMEVEIAPELEGWFKSSLYSESAKLADEGVISLGNPTRLELYFKSVRPQLFESLPKQRRDDLLERLKRMNTLRNKVVHRGLKPSREECVDALRAVGLLLSLGFGRSAAKE